MAGLFWRIGLMVVVLYLGWAFVQWDLAWPVGPDAQGARKHFALMVIWVGCALGAWEVAR